jgi:hypothetical protein
MHVKYGQKQGDNPNGQGEFPVNGYKISRSKQDIHFNGLTPSSAAPIMG